MTHNMFVVTHMICNGALHVFPSFFTVKIFYVETICKISFPQSLVDSRGCPEFSQSKNGIEHFVGESFLI